MKVWRSGDLARWASKDVLIVDVHGGWPPTLVDLRWTVSGTPGSRGEVSGHKRRVPAEELEVRP